MSSTHKAARSYFGSLLRAQRLAAGLSQEALAQRAGLSPKAVSDLERDPGRTPRLATAALLAEALGLAPGGREALIAAARPNEDAVASRPARRPSRLFLPRPLTPLVGREGVVAAVSELLLRGTQQLVTLTGPGGIGKTRVAIEVARKLAGSFPDGVVFVDLTPLRDPGLVLGAIAQGLGVEERDATPLLRRLELALGNKHLLVVLDNFEQVIDAAPQVVGLLELCPGLTVLATSRVALKVRGGREYSIAPLALPEGAGPPAEAAQSPAVQLFVERARAAGAELPPDAAALPDVAEICRRLEGLPLALELAGARVRLLPIPALLARLDQRLPLLAGGAHDMPARQRTMRDAIDWSHQLLGEAEKMLFRKLCVFWGGCTLEAAEAVCGASAGGMFLDHLEALVDSSLLRMEVKDAESQQARLILLETIREYGLERLEALGEGAAVRERHAAHYLSLAEEGTAQLAGPEAPAWLDRLEREQDNLWAALEWAHRQPDGATALRMVAALWPAWDQRGQIGEGRRWLNKALELEVDPTAATVPRVQALTGAATLAIRQAAHDEAAARCAQAVSLARELENSSYLVAASNVQGLLAREQDRYADSAAAYESALPIARSAGDHSGEAEALLGLAYAAMFTGEPARSEALAGESLALARGTADWRAEANALFLLAWQTINAGEYEEGKTVGSEALSLVRALGDTGAIAEVLFLLGTIGLFRGEYEEAANLLEEALAVNRDRGDETRLSRDLSGLGLAVFALGDVDRARPLIEESMTLALRLEEQWGIAMTATVMGHVELASNDVDRARDLFVQAAELFRSIGNPMYLPWCLEGLVAVAAARGDFAGAAELHGSAEAVRLEAGVKFPPIQPAEHERTLATVRAALAENEFDAARATGAVRRLEETIAKARAEGA